MSANFQQNPIYEKRCNTYWNKKAEFHATHDDSFWNNDYVLYQQHAPIKFDDRTLELFPDLQYL